MALSPTDRDLLDRLLRGEPNAWELFVDRWIGLVSQVVRFSADCRGVHLSAADREDLIADVFVTLLDRDMAALRSFQRRSSLATYLTVIARRVVIRRMMQTIGPGPAQHDGAAASTPNGEPPVEQRVADREQVAQMLGGLPAEEAAVVRMFHLEGRSYNEISRTIGMPENSIGPVLSRARMRMRRMAEPT
ncbi:sigma-70 family RNA polymerase sigma factor [Botrimarina sp.]|uniref:RNA polymerase sigma factor n=1 Tax=Botrimarina sp. TaxID=2795802 RepID=UPI0032ED2E3F